MKTKFLKLLFILMLMLSFSFLPFKAYAEDISTTDTIKGGFEIKVLVDGDSTPNADAEFEFTITKDGVAAVGTYSIDHASSLAIPSDGKIKLKANQIATLNDLPVGDYLVEETKLSESTYQTTSFSINGETAIEGLIANVKVSAITSNGGWNKNDSGLVKDREGYYTYTITSDLIDENGDIVVDCNPLAELMIETMQRNWLGTSDFKIKFINKTGTAISYKDYHFDTINWMPEGEIFTAPSTPTMEDIYGYGWGEVWKPITKSFKGVKAIGSLDTIGFDGYKIRLMSAPLRCINPAIISYFKSNLGKDSLTGNSDATASTITLKQMNAFPELIKQAFTFKNYEGVEINLEADEKRTYADFLCAFYDVDSLNDLTIAQKYNVLGTGYKGSPLMPYEGQSAITTYFSNISGIANKAIPHSDLNSGSLDYFKTWGFGGHYTGSDNDIYAYINNYYSLESDSEVLKMGYEYLYERCIRFTLDNSDYPISELTDNEETPLASVGGIKDYLDKNDDTNAHVFKAMNNGANINNGEAITLDNVAGYLVLPSTWNQHRRFDFGFNLTFKALEKVSKANVTFTNTYKASVGSIKVSNTVTGDLGDKNKDFSFKLTVDKPINGTYGDMTFVDGVTTFALKDNESKTAVNLPANLNYQIIENDNDGYTLTATRNSGTIIKNETIEATFVNHKASMPTIDGENNASGNAHSTNKTPHTGVDNSLWFSLMFASLLGLILVIIYSYNNRSKHSK